MEARDQVLEVWGDFACFSRPEMKVERFSYPIITPSAARGIFDAILCKPNKDPTQAQFRWEITRVEVLAPVSYIALRRNEVKEKVSSKLAQDWMNGKGELQPILADADKSITGSDTKGRTQRQTMALRDVRYRIHAQIRVWPGRESHLQALQAQFERRASQGKCVHQPYFGCREFPAYFEPADSVQETRAPVDWTQDLGLVVYDVFDLSLPGTCDSEPSVSLFRARVENGVLAVPPYESEAVLKPRGGNAGA